MAQPAGSRPLAGVEVYADDLGWSAAVAFVSLHHSQRRELALGGYEQLVTSPRHHGSNPAVRVCATSPARGSSTIRPVSDAVRIAILGDFNADFRSHHATNDALKHAARKLGMRVESEWLATPSLNKPETEKTLEGFDGIWASPGSPYKSFDGMLKGIEFARRRDWPFLGTCGGFQYAFIEFARHVLDIKDADSAENNSGSNNVVIYPVTCAVPDRKGNAPRLC